MIKLFQKYKELKQNKRLFGIIRLVLWLIPLSIVILIIRTSYHPSAPVVNVQKEENYLEKYQKMYSYKFDYQINDINYTGKYLDSTIVLENEYNDILIKDEEIYYAQMDRELMDTYYLYPKNVVNLISDSEEIATTSYNDGTLEYIYKKTDDDKDKEIKIKVLNNIITEISIVESDIKINISYYDIDELDFVIDYERYIENEEIYDNKGEYYEY